ncbi:MAG: hypothetical protein J3R72DRAFT_496344 [Linnemannia gamsii]|nr:MAG: hypothetical protein J3R72DRAFT_496344 [Linnemannia gamsii]
MPSLMQGKALPKQRRFGYSFATVYAIAKVFDSERSMKRKPRGGNRTRRLMQSHIDWLADRLSARSDTPIALLCQELALTPTLSLHFLQPQCREPSTAKQAITSNYCDSNR